MFETPRRRRRRRGCAVATSWRSGSGPSSRCSRRSAARGRAGGPGSSPTTTSAGSGRRSSAGSRASRRAPRRSGRGGRSGWSGGAASSSRTWRSARALDGNDGVLASRARLRSLDGQPDRRGRGRGRRAGRDHGRGRSTSTVDGGAAVVDGEIRIPDVATLVAAYPRRARALRRPGPRSAPVMRRLAIDVGRVGFRTLAAGPTRRPRHRPRRARSSMSTACRSSPAGPLWTPLDVVSLARRPDELRDALETVRAAGMNMVRLPGFGHVRAGRLPRRCATSSASSSGRT